MRKIKTERLQDDPRAISVFPPASRNERIIESAKNFATAWLKFCKGTSVWAVSEAWPDFEIAANEVLNAVNGAEEPTQ
jgi:hypothetical protein